MYYSKRNPPSQDIFLFCSRHTVVEDQCPDVHIGMLGDQIRVHYFFTYRTIMFYTTFQTDISHLIN